jgi:hypothetical protein
MKLADLNEYIQTLAGLGALVALMAVGWEIREGNRIASQQAASVSWIQWIETASADLESGISEVTAKAELKPDELTLQDKMDMDLWLQRRIYLYSHDYVVQLWEADPDVAQNTLNELEADAAIIFGSRFARAWIRLNAEWINPELLAAIERGVEGAPITSNLDYYESLDAIAATIE